MFWEAIAYGLRQITHLEIWLSIFIYGLVIGLLFLALRYTMENNKRKGGPKFIGLLSSLLKGHLIQAIVVAIMVIELLPILAGGDDFTSLDFIADNFGGIFKAVFIASTIIYIVSLIPFIRKFISKSPGTTIFLEGAIIFHLLANRVLTDIVNQPNPNAIVLPSFLSMAGFLILLFVFTNIVSKFIINLLVKLKILDDYAINRHTFLIGNFVGVLPGLLSLCIYCSYIRLLIIDAAIHTVQ